MRVLITTPELTKQGGVSNYVATLGRYLGVQSDLFVVGRRRRRENGWGALTRLVKDSLGFYRKTEARCWDVVHLNPSLAWKAIPMDSLLIGNTTDHKRNFNLGGA
jgi:hypothetical protein